MLGAKINGGNPSDGRRADDFYPTPANVTHALLAHWRPSKTEVCEPACGDGAISKVLTDAGYTVHATDLVYRGYGTGDVDFLTTDTLPAECIITNPPFNLASQFIEHSFALGAKEIALVLKATYWHAASRASLWAKHRPSFIMPLLWRPDFLNKGAPTMEVMWCVWDSRTQGNPTTYIPLPKPA